MKTNFIKLCFRKTREIFGKFVAWDYSEATLLAICAVFALLVFFIKTDIPRSKLKDLALFQNESLQSESAADEQKVESTVLSSESKSSAIFFLKFSIKLKKILLIFLPIFILIFYKRKLARLPLLILYGLLGLIAWLPAEVIANLEEFRGSSVGELTSPMTYAMNLVLLGTLFFMPALLYFLYYRSSIMDKYLTMQFIPPFIVSNVALSALWIIIDLQDNGWDFIKSGTSIAGVAQFYFVQVPWLVVEFLPITLLLSMLFCLGKMSKANEIVSMIGAGRSLFRVLSPLIIFSLIATYVSLAFNYEKAPWAKGAKNAVHEEITSEDDEDDRARYFAKNLVYHNAQSGRTWFIRRVPMDLERDKIRDIAIIVTNENGEVTREIFADSAKWVQRQGKPPMWILWHGRIVDYVKQEIKDDIFQKTFTVATPKITEIRARFRFPDNHVNSLYPNDEVWEETPWQLVSDGIDPEYLGVPKLTSYLKAKRGSTTSQKLASFYTHWHQRFSVPLWCLIVALFTAPLGVVWSRRGFVGAVTIAVALYILLFFLNAISGAMGSGGTLSPLLAAWAWNFIFLLLGLYLLYNKDKNNELISIKKIVLYFKNAIHQIRPEKA